MSAATAAYVGARCGICMGLPPNPPPGAWHSLRNSTTCAADGPLAGMSAPSKASECVSQ